MSNAATLVEFHLRSMWNWRSPSWWLGWVG